MTDVNIVCDRCKQEIHGMREPGMTASFYDVTGLPWSKFADSGEQVICDRCMWNDARYQADYGVQHGTISNRRIVKVTHCSACGEDHEAVGFSRMTQIFLWDWWGICPTTGQRILMRDLVFDDPMQGKRIDRPDGSIPQSGEYGKGEDGHWQCCPPGTNLVGSLAGHQVTEHEDRTITVSPSILIWQDLPTGRIEWHGFLEHGVWREV
jgi:hypothetical protein